MKPYVVKLRLGDESEEPESPTEGAHPTPEDKLDTVLELLAQHGLAVADVTMEQGHGTPAPNRWFALRKSNDPTVKRWVSAD